MTTQAFFGILSGLLILVGGIPYLTSLYRREIEPHLLSWLGWGCITALGAFAMLASGSTWAAAIVFANTLFCFLVVWLGIICKVGVWQGNRYDPWLFSIGVLGLILWQVLSLPILALIASLVADFCFGLPTVLKTWKNPKSETVFPWFLYTLSGFASLFSIHMISFSELAYPLYLFCFDGLVFLLTLGIIKKK